MRDFRKGDQVRIGKGKVDYTVFENQLTRVVFLQSNNTGKITEVDMERVVLVQAVEDVAYEAGCDVSELNLSDQTPPGTEPVSDEAWGAGPDVCEHGLTGDACNGRGGAEDEDWNAMVAGLKKNDHRESTYGRTILGALNRLGKHVYAGTATTKRRNKTQKKAEKARRRQARDARRAKYESDRTVV